MIAVKDFRYTPEKLERKSLTTLITLSNGNQGVADTKTPPKIHENSANLHTLL
jgi:hypothetical protein